MNNFENAQIGDEVLVARKAGFKTYLVKSRIEKITKTKITVDGNRYKKHNGPEVADGR